VLLCTPPAAVGVLMLATANGQRSHRLVRLVTGLIVGGVVLCTLVLVICAIAALAEGITDLTTGREAGIWWLIIATVLTAMATTAVLALRAAWRKRR
jgi:hypothetical protein